MLLRGIVTLLLATVASLLAADEMRPSYPFDYPAAEQFCPPMDGVFDEVQRTVDRVRSRTFRHQLNGGYGLAAVGKVGDQHLLHLGADVGWYRVGDPVFVVANGVVRLSQSESEHGVAGKTGGKDRAAANNTEKGAVTGPRSPVNEKGSRALAWGNVVVIEHRLANDEFATTIYGHLANERLVKAGDVVRAGQQIGVIGTTKVNGGYKPHLHFGVRSGRLIEVGRKVLMPIEGQFAQLEVLKVNEKGGSVTIKGGAKLPAWVQVGQSGPKFEVRQVGEDQTELPATLVSVLPSPEFAIVGYGVAKDGWLDPIAFLTSHGADTNPAPFESARVERRGKGR